MAKYKTIVDNVNLWLNDEVVEVLKKGTIIEVEKIIPGYSMKSVIPVKTTEIAVLKDGCEVIASYNGKASIESIKNKSTKKKGE